MDCCVPERGSSYRRKKERKKEGYKRQNDFASTMKKSSILCKYTYMK